MQKFISMHYYMCIIKTWQQLVILARTMNNLSNGGFLLLSKSHPSWKYINISVALEYHLTHNWFLPRKLHMTANTTLRDENVKWLSTHNINLYIIHIFTKMVLDVIVTNSVHHEKQLCSYAGCWLSVVLIREQKVLMVQGENRETFLLNIRRSESPHRHQEHCKQSMPLCHCVISNTRANSFYLLLSLIS